MGLTEARHASSHLFHHLLVQLDPQPRRGGDGQHAITIQLERGDQDIVNIGGGGYVLHVDGDRHGGHQMQVSRQAHCRVPAVRNELDVVVVSHPGNAPAFRKPAHFGQVGLDDIDRPPLDPGDEAF